MSTCDCLDYADLELSRSAISRRIRETKQLEKRLELAHDTRAELRLYRCPACEQLWQWNRAFNWGNDPYLFRVPCVSLAEWIAEPFQAPDEMLIHSAVMSDFFAKNHFTDGDRPCGSPRCSRFAARRIATCVQHHVESLQKLGNLPPEPTGRLFPPYHLGVAARSMRLEVVDGDLLEQDVDAIVNAWNRNILPWWLLVPQGVSGAIKRRGGTAPFRELARTGPLPLGQARLTSAGKLPYRGIIHVAGISMLWRASERSVRLSVRNALRLAKEAGFRSLAMPTIGAGTGGLSEERVVDLLIEEAQASDFDGLVRVVRFRRTPVGVEE